MKLNKGFKPRYRSSSLMFKIPAGAKRLIVTFKTKPVKFNMQLGDSLGFETTGYVSKSVVGTLT